MRLWNLVMSLAKSLGVLCIAVTVFWATAEKSVTMECEAIVHVMEHHVEITIDDQVFPIEDDNVAPIVCQLRPGRHVLQMLRNGFLLQEEEFSLAPGQQAVFTAWDPERAKSENSRHEQVHHEFVVFGRGKADVR
jgi:hypothetical protein